MSAEFTLSFLKLGLVLILSSIMGATAVTFLRVRLEKRAREFSHLMGILAMEKDEAESALSAMKAEFATQDYVLPTIFASLVSFAGFAALLFGGELVSINPGAPNFLLTGGFSSDSIAEMQAIRIKTMTTITFGFVGAFIWSARHIVRRLMNGDLTPNTYYASGLRIVFATLIALVLSLVLNTSPAGEYVGSLLPAMAFLAGMLPDETFIYIREKAGVFKGRPEMAAQELPLEMIEGINAFNKTRLGEVDVDDVQNLAEANLIELLLKTPFSPYKLVDWIAQAKLVLCFGPDVLQLRKLGIRTILDLRLALNSEEMCRHIAEEAGVSELSLHLLRRQVSEDPAVARLHDFKQSLSEHALRMPTHGDS